MAEEDDWDDWGSDEETTASPRAPPSPVAYVASVPPPILEAMQSTLTEYQIALSDPALPPRLNSLLQPALQSIALDLFKYYSTSPELYEYTLTKELHRLDYKFTTSDNESSANPFELLKYPPSPGSTLHHIIAAANQSILAPLLEQLYSPPFAALLLPVQFRDSNYLSTATSFSVFPHCLIVNTTIDIHIPLLHLSTVKFQLNYTPIPDLNDASCSIICTDIRGALLPDLLSTLSTIYKNAGYDASGIVAPRNPVTLSSLRDKMMKETSSLRDNSSQVLNQAVAATGGGKVFGIGEFC